MKSRYFFQSLTIALAAGMIFTLSCSKNKKTDLAAAYLPQEVPVVTGQESQDAAIYLGRALFYDKVLSRTNNISCASCHKQVNAFADNVALSDGFEGRKTLRNSIAIQNIFDGGLNPFGSKPLFWDGRENSIFSLVTKPIANHIEMGMDDMDELMVKVNQRDYVAPLALKAYGNSQLNAELLSQSMVAFMQTIRTDSCRFNQDKIMNVPRSLSPLEEQGLALFNTTYQCNKCHQPGSIGFYDNTSFANIGLDGSNTDIGFMRVTKLESDRGRFKIPDLHNVMLTAPYMHDGRFATIDDVLDHYSHGIQQNSNLDTRLMENGHPIRLNIKASDRDAIKAFLATLTDYHMVSNPLLSNPFKLSY